MRRPGIAALAVALAGSLGVGSAWADDGWSAKGWVGISSLNFLVDRSPDFINDGVLLETEVDIGYAFGETWRFKLRPFISIDMMEESRNRFQALDGYVEYRSPHWALLAGQLVESWAVTDRFSPIDVLNRRDFGYDTYNPPKLGDLALGRLGVFLPDALGVREPTLQLYFLPVFQPSLLPGNDDRFAFDLTGDGEGDLSDSDVTPSPDIAYAARLSAVIGSADVSLIYFGGPARTPSFANILPAGVIVPTYFRVDTIGTGVRWALGAWLLKLEAAYTSTSNDALPSRLRGAVPPSYFQYVVGIERSFPDLIGKNELTLSVEFAGEEKPSPFVTLAGLRPYKSDFLIAARWAFNDQRRTEVRVTAAVDVLINEQLWEGTFQTQIYGGFKFLLTGQFVNRAPRSEGLTVFNLFPNNSNIRAAVRFEF